MLRVKRADLADRGVERLTARVTGTRGGLPLLGTHRDSALVADRIVRRAAKAPAPAAA